MRLFLALSTAVWFILEVSFSLLVHIVFKLNFMYIIQRVYHVTVHDSVSCGDLASYCVSVLDTKLYLIVDLWLYEITNNTGMCGGKRTLLGGDETERIL